MDLYVDFAKGLATRQGRKPPGFVWICRESETGRTPRALSDPNRPGRLETRQDGADARAGEAPTALRGREMVAEDALDGADAFTERPEIRLRYAGRNLHQRAPAKFCGG